ncbi:MAG: 16S rRNA (guanine(527)-N(7))-methyltransferase RsmG [Bacteroidia bacterium]|nr:16S rRNA (guanine(527)-N(7))-methyltransferase RsmG [Bacteroidia bacterium]
MEIIKKYFTELEIQKLDKLNHFAFLATEFNKKVNIISRKDIDNIETNHILHSLSPAKFVCFKPNTKIIDIGTGGGFPGIPLAIMFPDTKFYLIDSIKKKIDGVKEIINALELKNAEAINCRVETLRNIYADFIVSRAVAPISQLYKWSNHLVSNKNSNDIKNGYILLKGGDLTEEINQFYKECSFIKKINEVKLSNYFSEEFFETKKLIYFSSSR